jgi:putative thioredoxin
MSDAPEPDEAADAIAAVEADPADHEARYELAETLAASGRNGEAINQLLEILSVDLKWQDGKAKDKLLQIFEAAGPKDEATIEGRHRLSSLMFS